MQLGNGCKECHIDDSGHHSGGGSGSGSGAGENGVVSGVVSVRGSFSETKQINMFLSFFCIFIPMRNFLIKKIHLGTKKNSAHNMPVLSIYLAKNAFLRDFTIFGTWFTDFTQVIMC